MTYILGLSIFMLVMFIIQLYFIKITNEISTEISGVLRYLKMIDQDTGNIVDILTCKKEYQEIRKENIEKMKRDWDILAPQYQDAIKKWHSEFEITS